MREIFRAGALCLLATLLATSCSSKRAKTEEPSKPQGEERKEKPAVPGMIPDECEALLNKSQEWKYIPGHKWKASSPSEMLEVAKFFSAFRLVPVATSDKIRELERSDASMPAEAKALLKSYSRHQVCDLFLAQTFLQALADYRWSSADRPEAGRHLHRFLLNQQAIELPLLHRALEAQIFVRAVKKGLVPGAAAKAIALGGWIEKAFSQLPALGEAPTPVQEWNLFKAELELSDKIRDRLGAILPLP